jgi:carboxypeptidase C (cathepsin A)
MRWGTVVSGQPQLGSAFTFLLSVSSLDEATDLRTHNQSISKGVFMYRSVISANLIATVLVVGIAFMPTRADAAKTSSAEKAALKEATVACKAEAKEKKIRWPASRKFVSTCVAKSIKLTPAQLQELAVKQAIVACKAEAKGKKIRWPSSRKFVSSCLSNALKDYAIDTDQLRRELNTAGLRSYTPIETGCLQNVYCEDQ